MATETRRPLKPFLIRVGDVTLRTTDERGVTALEVSGIRAGRLELSPDAFDELMAIVLVLEKARS